ncbi:BpsFReDn18 [Biomphalaria pfeifferi]|uniref:BpsFReDn18 n=1 Tax=Biomphalaria pfeifferi TaxID=112525 RepID=A0AAD8BUZ1_BIOPF|nr:BpsFReDn18 [Biomphalaria pfeifferi]
MTLHINAAVFGLLLFAIAIQVSNAEDACPPPERFCTQRMNIDSNAAFVRSYVPFLCDAETDGERWIIIQSRLHRDTSFNRNWTEYKNGFGTTCTDYWLGNEIIHQITSMNNFELRIDLFASENRYYATYRNFKVGSEKDNYRLSLGEFFKGNTNDDLRTHDNMSFSTPDRDNDNNPEYFCAQRYESGWWFNKCLKVNLNGHFDTTMTGKHVIWYAVTGYTKSVTSVEMKIRKMN